MSEKPFDAIRKNAIAIRISREMALDFSLVEPTPEERSERHARAVKFKAWQHRHAEQEGSMLAALYEMTDPVTVAMLDLHKRGINDYSSDPICDGCDYQGYEADPIEWPCATVYALAKVHGIPTPEEYRP